MSLKKLSFLTATLFILSVAVYINENRRGSDLLAGSYYITGLDVGSIERIVIGLAGEEKITLAKKGERFILEGHKSYPAATDRVNELLFQITGIEVAEKTVSEASEEDIVAYELDEESKKYSLSLVNREGNELAGFSVGKSYRGRGDYLLKNGEKDIYLSKAPLGIGTTYKSFVDTALFSIDEAEVEHLELKGNGRAMVFSGPAGNLTFQGPGGQNFKKEKIDEYLGALGTLRFEDFFTENDTEIQRVNFNRNLTIRLAGGLVYEASFATREENYWVRLKASVHEGQRAQTPDEEDSTANVSKVVEAQAQAERVNREHSSWIYKIGQAAFERMIKEASFFR